MRTGFWVVTLCALGAACGGSSSETPFPIEPNQAELRAGALKRAHHIVVTKKKDAGESLEDETDEESAPPDKAPNETSGADAGATEHATEGRTGESNAPASGARGTSEADSGALAPGRGGPPTWGGSVPPAKTRH